MPSGTSHRYNMVMVYKTRPLFHGWPGNGLNLNPIKSLWSQIKQLPNTKCIVGCKADENRSKNMWETSPTTFNLSRTAC